MTGLGAGSVPALAEPPADRRVRDLVAAGLWLVVAACWTFSALVPWFEGGLLARNSPVELAGLLRTDALSAVLPGVTAYAVLVLPVWGAVLLGLAPLRGRTVLVARVLLWLTGTVLVAAAISLLGELAGDRLAAGAVLALLGAVTGLLALPLATVRRADDPSRV
jgi:hypothetical protein